MNKNVNHANLFVDGLAYCEKARQVVPYDDAFLYNVCHRCSFYNGSAQGEGVECLYPDSGVKDSFTRAESPAEEFARRSKLPPAQQNWDEDTEKSLAHVVTLK